MPSKPAPRTAAIRRWVALCSVMVFLSVWLAVLTLGKGGLATSKASAPATTTTTSSSTSTDTTGSQTETQTQSDQSLDDQSALSQDQSSGGTSQNDAPSLSTSQS